MKQLFALLLLIVLLGCDSSNTSHQKTSKPNIVFLFADDMTYHAVRSLGNMEIHTPNLDRLVNGGTTFTHAYNMGGWHGAVCVASRTMLMSGKSLWRSRESETAWRDRDSLALQQSWGKIMSRNGYNTYMSGKWHVAAPADIVFELARHVRPGMPPDSWRTRSEEQKEAIANYRSNGVDLKTVMPNGYHRPNDKNDDSWSPSDTSKGGFWKGGKHWSEVLKDDALDYIADASSRDLPFFMYLAFNAPHDPRQAPQEFVDMYQQEALTAPVNWLPEYPYKDDMGNGPGLRDEALAPYPRTEYAIQTHIKEYYAIITHLDAQIGKILDALEQSGKMDNTYVFFSADHGLSVGNHGLIGKQNMYDHSVRVPLMMMGPGVPAGQQVASDVYLQDIMATSLDLAGIDKPDFVEFNSLLPQAQGKTTNGSYDAIYGAYIDLQRMVRKDGFKLIVYPKINRLRLFDLTKDPKEMNDLAEDPAYAEKVQQLLAELRQLQEEFGDQLDLSGLGS
ncbi:MAG: sulfatase-like hydrolase/transferase [Bacteroidota bacterium]